MTEGLSCYNVEYTIENEKYFINVFSNIPDINKYITEKKMGIITLIQLIE